MDLVADLHTHTIASGHAYSTVLENVRAARLRGLQAIAITDHGPKIPGGPCPLYFGNLKMLPQQIEGITIYRGVEANVLDFNGSLDLPEDTLKLLDIVLAGFHPRCYPGGNVEENTQAMIEAIRNPLVDVIVHPGNPKYAVDFHRVVAAALKSQVALEINNSSLQISREGSYDNCLQIAREVARTGAFVVVGSDAHWSGEVGNFKAAIRILEKAGVTEEQVINTSLSKIKSYLQDRHSKR